MLEENGLFLSSTPVRTTGVKWKRPTPSRPLSCGHLWCTAWQLTVQEWLTAQSSLARAQLSLRDKAICHMPDRERQSARGIRQPKCKRRTPLPKEVSDSSAFSQNIPRHSRPQHTLETHRKDGELGIFKRLPSNEPIRDTETSTRLCPLPVQTRATEARPSYPTFPEGANVRLPHPNCKSLAPPDH